MSVKILDCITFFEENFMANLRFEILNSVVDYFVICESQYNHRNVKKKFNFKLKNKKFRNKIIYIKLENPFPSNKDLWKNQAYQRDFMLSEIKKNINISSDDMILFSDPDEIPNPQLLKKISLSKKFGIFMQKHFMYKFNILADQYSPWEGTRIAKLKNIKSIEYMRQKVLKKNIRKWWRPDKERNIQIILNGGWHFNNFLKPTELSRKLKTFAHSEFSSSEYSNPTIIKNKINNNEDLFGRGHFFKKISISKAKILLPLYVRKNTKLFLKYFKK